MFEELPTPVEAGPGPAERDALRAIRANVAGGYMVADRDAALARAILDGFHALDLMRERRLPYGPAKLLPAVAELLREAHMTPESRRQLSSAQDETMTALSKLFDDVADPASPIRDPA